MFNKFKKYINVVYVYFQLLSDHTFFAHDSSWFSPNSVRQDLPVYHVMWAQQSWRLRPMLGRNSDKSCEKIVWKPSQMTRFLLPIHCDSIRHNLFQSAPNQYLVAYKCEQQHLLLILSSIFGRCKKISIYMSHNHHFSIVIDVILTVQWKSEIVILMSHLLLRVMYANIVFFSKRNKKVVIIVYGHLIIKNLCFIMPILWNLEILLTIPYNPIWLGKISSNCIRLHTIL